MIEKLFIITKRMQNERENLCTKRMQNKREKSCYIHNSIIGGKKKNIESLNERLMKLYNILKALSASLIVYLDTYYCELKQCNDGVVLAKETY